ncbi:MAG: DUF4915 domain-containing protein [Cyanophyceae cyanobacterium]
MVARSGVWVVNLQTGQTVAFLRFEEAVQEIFAVQILPGIRYPEIVDWDEKLIASSYVLPDEALADVPMELNHSRGAVGKGKRGKGKGFN